MDALFAGVRPTPWGAVVTDDRYPRIWDANYARVERPASLADVAAELTPALRRAGVGIFHVVLLDPETDPALLASLSTIGHRLAWDVVMDVASGSLPAPTGEVVELADGPALWEAVTTSLELFGVTPGDEMVQLRRSRPTCSCPAASAGTRSARRAGWCRSRRCTSSTAWVPRQRRHGPRGAGRGYASDLVLRVVRDAAHSSDRTILLVDPGDASVVALHARLGFGEVTRFASTKGPIPQGTNL
jgi:hypothetical protein